MERAEGKSFKFKKKPGKEKAKIQSVDSRFIPLPFSPASRRNEKAWTRMRKCINGPLEFWCKTAACRDKRIIRYRVLERKQGSPRGRSRALDVTVAFRSNRIPSRRRREPLSAVSLSFHAFSFVSKRDARPPKLFFFFFFCFPRKVIGRQPRKQGVKHWRRYKRDGTRKRILLLLLFFSLRRKLLLFVFEGWWSLGRIRLVNSTLLSFGTPPPLSLSPLWKSWKLLYPRPSPSPSPSPASKRSALLRDLEEQYNKRDEARGREEGGCRGGLEGTGVLLISKVPKLIIRSPRSRPAKGEGTQFLGRHGFTFNFL